MNRAAIAAVVLAFAATAAAAPDSDGKAARAEAVAAQKLYTAGDYAAAAARFAHAYALDPQPAYLFNAAQAYRFAKDCANAAKLYRQFLDLAKQADAQNLDKVRGYIAEMDACTPPTPASAPEPRPEAKAEPARPVEPTELADPGRGKRQLGIGIGAVGVAGLVTGVALTALVKSDEITCTLASPCSYDRLQRANSDGTRHEHYEIAAYSIGAGALATGIVLYMLGRHDASESMVTVAPTRDGAAVRIRF